MRKIQSFFTGIFLLATVFAMLVLATLVYRANENSSIKSYIFQINNSARQRVGNLQNLDNMSAADLRDKLIRKYVSEYFKVIPGDTNVENRVALKNLSSQSAFQQWQQTEAKIISDMSEKNMFRTVREVGVATYNKNSGNSNDEETMSYIVRYYTTTWTDSNVMGIEPIYDDGILYLEIRFVPGIRKTINGKNFDIRSYLESGKDPTGLFQFMVINIGEKQ